MDFRSFFVIRLLFTVILSSIKTKRELAHVFDFVLDGMSCEAGTHAS